MNLFYTYLYREEGKGGNRHGRALGCFASSFLTQRKRGKPKINKTKWKASLLKASELGALRIWIGLLLLRQLNDPRFFSLLIPGKIRTGFQNKNFLLKLFKFRGSSVFCICYVCKIKHCVINIIAFFLQMRKFWSKNWGFWISEITFIERYDKKPFCLHHIGIFVFYTWFVKAFRAEITGNS